MSWAILLVAGIFEVMWATSLKASDGFTRFGSSVFTIVTLILSFVFLAMALKNLPVGTAYAVWTGIGAVGTVITGVLLFNEPFDFSRLACLAMIISGIAGLRLLS